MGKQDPLRSCFLRLAGGDMEALAEIYDRSASDLYGLALWRTRSKEDAANVLQDVFVRLSERREELPEVRNPRGWLLTMTHRLTVDLARRKRIRRAADIEDCSGLLVTPPAAESDVDAATASRRLAELPDAQREVLYLRHFADLTYAEIGKVMGIPTFTAASRHRLGLKRLRRRLGVKEHS